MVYRSSSGRGIVIISRDTRLAQLPVTHLVVDAPKPPAADMYHLLPATPQAIATSTQGVL